MLNINLVDIQEPIRAGFADILYHNGKEIIIHELRSDAVMISMHHLEKLTELIERFHLADYTLFSVKQKEVADLLVHQYHKTFQFACYQAVYPKKEKIAIQLPISTSIQPVEEKHKDMIYRSYQLMEHDYIDDKIARKHLWGLFVQKQLAGFIGIHDEGSMGMLEILPEFRRQGYGALLESFLINEFLNRNHIPFCQVKEHNEASLSLQRKLGMEITDELTYWLF